MAYARRAFQWHFMKRLRNREAHRRMFLGAGAPPAAPPSRRSGSNSASCYLGEAVSAPCGQPSAGRSWRLRPLCDDFWTCINCRGEEGAVGRERVDYLTKQNIAPSRIAEVTQPALPVALFVMCNIPSLAL